MFSLVPRNRALYSTNNDDIANPSLFVCCDDDDDEHFRLILFMFRRNWPSGLNSQAAQTAGKEKQGGRKEGKCSK